MKTLRHPTTGKLVRGDDGKLRGGEPGDPCCCDQFCPPNQPTAVMAYLPPFDVSWTIGEFEGTPDYPPGTVIRYVWAGGWVESSPQLSHPELCAWQFPYQADFYHDGQGPEYHSWTWNHATVAKNAYYGAWLASYGGGKLDPLAEGLKYTGTSPIGSYTNGWEVQ